MVIRCVSGFSLDLQDAVAASQRLADIRAVSDMRRSLGGSLGKADLRRHASAPGTDAKGEAGRAGTRCGVPAAASVRARTRIRCASSILNWLSPEGFASTSAAIAARRNASGPGLDAFQNFLGRAGPPRFGGNAAKRQPRIPDGALFDPQRRGGRHDREGVGGAFADLQIACMRREPARLARQPQRDDQIARLERAFPLGRVAGQTMKRLDRNLAPAGSALDLHDSVEGDQRHAEIRRVGGDAGLAPAEHGMQSILAVTGIATRARFALVAGAGGHRRNTRIASAAADCRRRSRHCEAAPRRRTEAPRPRPDRTVAKSGIVREIGIANQRADADAAIGQTFDAVEPRQARDVDETVRTGDPALHQVEQIGAGREIGGAWFGRGRDGVGDGGGPDIVESLHAERLWSASTRLVLCVQHRVRDSGISPAPAEVSAHAFAHALRVIAGLPFPDQADRAHDLAGRAEPALEAVMSDESGLDADEVRRRGRRPRS